MNDKPSFLRRATQCFENSSQSPAEEINPATTIINCEASSPLASKAEVMPIKYVSPITRERTAYSGKVFKRRIFLRGWRIRSALWNVCGLKAWNQGGVFF